MMAYTLRYAEELRDAQDYFSDIAEPTIGKKELSLAGKLIKSHFASFRLDQFKDDYEAALPELIEAKRTETPFPVVEEKPRPKVVNLIDALRRSVDESRAKPSEPERKAKKGPTLVKSGKRSHRAA